MHIFPTELQREILSYLISFDKLEYARCNKSLYRELVTGFRIISLRRIDVGQYLSDESFRHNVLVLIVDPYKQLQLHLDNFTEWNLPVNSQFRTLSILVRDLHRVLPHITRVHHLELNWEYERFHQHFNNNEFTFPIVDGLRMLSFKGYCKASLVSLRDQLDFRNLQSLKLNACPYLSDVSCLDHIYELHLSFCPDLVDISCLNNNQIIKIHLCAVVDYSQSFRFSRDISIVAAYRYLHGNISTLKVLISLILKQYNRFL